MKDTHSHDYIKTRLRALTGRIYNLNDDTIDALAECAILTEVQRGNSFCKQGHPYYFLSFINKGIFRMFHIFNNEDRTIAFACEGDPFMSVSSYLYDQPSEYTLEAVEDSSIISISNQNLKQLCNTTDFNNWFQRAMLGQIYAIEQRCVWFGNNDAYSRYAKLIEIRSDIIHRIPLKFVASYLGIKQETLSRIRSKYFRSNPQLNFDPLDLPSHPL